MAILDLCSGLSRPLPEENELMLRFGLFSGYFSLLWLEFTVPDTLEQTALFRVLFHYSDLFLAEYKRRFEKEYGFLRPIIKGLTVGHHEP